MEIQACERHKLAVAFCIQCRDEEIDRLRQELKDEKERFARIAANLSCSPEHRCNQIEGKIREGK